MEVVPAFIDETGVLTTSIKDQPVYGIGLLIVHNPAEVTDDFCRLHFSHASGRREQRSKLREEIRQGARLPALRELDRLMWSTRHHEYKFSEVTAHNLQHYISLLNLYFSLDSFEFHALLLDRSASGFNLSQWGNDPWRAYVVLGRELLERGLNRPVFAIVDLQGRPGSSSVTVEGEFCSVEYVAGCLRATSETQVFLQVVDVLLGCVQADWKDWNGFYDPGSKRAEAKRALVNFMRTKLALPDGQPIISRKRPVREMTAPSLFTVQLRPD